MRTSPGARLAQLTRDRYGVFTPAQAAEVSVGRSQVQRMKQRGEVDELLPRVYGLAAIPDSWERRAVAAQLSGGPAAVLSHGTAARIHGLEHLGVGRFPDLELTYPFDGRPKGLPYRLHASKVLRPGDVVAVRCFRVTSAVFTIAAMAVRRAPHRIAKALDAAIVARHATVADARALVIRMWHTPGVVHLREALELLTPGAMLTRSERERLFLQVCATFGLPLPEANVRVRDANGDLRYVDFLFRAAGLVVEINAHPSHGTTLGRRLDGARQNALVPRFVVLNYDDRDLLQAADRIADEVRRSLTELTSPG